MCGSVRVEEGGQMVRTEVGKGEVMSGFQDTTRSLDSAASATASDL